MTRLEEDRWLSSVLEHLEPREFVILGDLDNEGHYVQAVKDEDQFVIECSGPVQAGGTALLTTAQERALKALGFGDDHFGDAEDYPNFRAFWGLGDTGQVAATMLSALRVLEIPPDRVERKRERFLD